MVEAVQRDVRRRGSVSAIVIPMTPPHPRHLPYVLRVIRARPRLMISIAVGLVVLALLPSAWRITTRLLVGWDAGVALYLVLVYTLFARSGSGQIRRYALRQDEGRV